MNLFVNEEGCSRVALFFDVRVAVEEKKAEIDTNGWTVFIIFALEIVVSRK